MKFIIWELNLMSTSFEIPEYSANADALGTLRILEAIRILKLQKNLSIIKRQRLKYLEILLFRKMKKLHLDLEVLMLYRNYTRTGQQ